MRSEWKTSPTRSSSASSRAGGRRAPRWSGTPSSSWRGRQGFRRSSNGGSNFWTRRQSHARRVGPKWSRPYARVTRSDSRPLRMTPMSRWRRPTKRFVGCSANSRRTQAGSDHVAEEDFEVLAFGEAGGEEVVGGGAAALEDADLAAGLLGAGGDDPLERLGVDVLRA